MINHEEPLELDELDLSVESAFDKSLPSRPPVISEYHYIQTNFNKVRKELWDHFNHRGHGLINHCYGGGRLFYKKWITKLTDEEWNEVRMHKILNTLWYVREYQSDYIPSWFDRLKNVIRNKFRNKSK